MHFAWITPISVLTAIYCIPTASIWGQDTSQPPKTKEKASVVFQTGLGLGTDAQVFVPHLQGEALFRIPIAPAFEFQLMAGARFQLMHLNEKAFHTSFQNRPETLEFDSLMVQNIRVGALNVHVGAAFKFFKKAVIGADIDLLGWSFGSRGLFEYHAHNHPMDGNFEWASPEPFNAMLMGRNDRGSLNSRFWIGWEFHPKWTVQAGLTIVHIIYRTENILQYENDRFFSDYKGGFAAVSFRPFLK